MGKVKPHAKRRRDNEIKNTACQQAVRSEEDVLSKKRINEKKRWRQAHFNKFVGNANKGHGFSVQKKEMVMQEYNETLKKEGIKNAAAMEDFGNTSRWKNASGHKTSTAFKKAQTEYEKLKKEKDEQHQAFLKAKQEREAALQKYKDKKLQKNMVLSRRTKKGQPIMKYRMEQLLATLEKQLASERNG